MSDEIGDLIEKPGERRIDWRVLHFLSLPSEVDKRVRSPAFFFAGAAWSFLLYTNGQSKNPSEGFVGLYLVLRSSGPPKTVNFSLGLRKANGEEEVLHPNLSHTFIKADGDWGLSKFIARSKLLERKQLHITEDTLTVTSTLSVQDAQSSHDSLSTRLWNLSLDLETVLTTRADADIKLKLSDGELDAHKMILKARSSVLGRMFSHDDLMESQTGEVKIEEGDMESFEVVLAYIYTGNPRGLSPENVKDVYKISHKYDLRDLTRCCSEFLRAGLSVETICDVVRIADLYEDKKLMEGAKDYFVGHKDEIRKTDQWKVLKDVNSKIVCEILEYALDKK